MKATTRAAAGWTAVYAALLTAPLVVGVLSDPFIGPRPFARDLSVALGFLALTLSALQFALISRVAATSRAFGSDALLSLHRAAGILAMLFMLAHPLLLADVPWRAWWPGQGPGAWLAGQLALGAGIVVLLTTMARRQLALRYERWQMIHLAGAIAVVVGGAWHAWRIDGYSQAPAMRVTLAGLVIGFTWLVARHHVARPWRLDRRPWQVDRNDDVGGRTRLLRLSAIGHDGFTFDAGQFAWLMTGRSPWWAEQHPLSIASAATPSPAGSVEFAIKALGDWSGTVVPALAPGTRVWIDGPYGAFTPASDDASRLVLIAGGIGIAPMRSILLTLGARPSARPVTLLYAAAGRHRAIDLADVEARMAPGQLDVVRVFESGGSPDPQSGVEIGRVNADLLQRRVPALLAAHEYYICGPLPMIDATTAALGALGVPGRRVHTERFQMI